MKFECVKEIECQSVLRLKYYEITIRFDMALLCTLTCFPVLFFFLTMTVGCWKRGNQCLITLFTEGLQQHFLKLILLLFLRHSNWWKMYHRVTEQMNCKHPFLRSFTAFTCICSLFQFLLRIKGVSIYCTY